jgi:hypothetical protein
MEDKNWDLFLRSFFGIRPVGLSLNSQASTASVLGSCGKKRKQLSKLAAFIVTTIVIPIPKHF